jgi:Flp pilus assembly pilin Flp
MNCKHGSTARDLHDDRGTITVEYAVLLSLVSVGCALATVSLGVPLVKMFMAQELWLALAIP